jgi:hypothetical protein
MNKNFKNILKILDQADAVDINEGRVAYFRYLEVCRQIADRYGYDLPLVVAVVAATSPNCDYRGNLRSALTIIDAHKNGIPFERITVSSYRQCGERAYSYLDGVDFLGTVKGPKIRAFYTNIMYPLDPHPVTIDGHAINIWRGKRIRLNQIKTFKYEAVAEDYREAARRVRLLPNQLQAITWFTWKRINKIIYNPQPNFFTHKPDDFWQTLGTFDGLEPYQLKRHATV